MFQVIFLVDATEPLNFLIGPLFYLYIRAKIDSSKLKKVYLHFIPAIFYFFYSILFHLKSIELKYNSYLSQYHPELNYVNVPGGNFADPLFLKSIVNELTIISIFVYLLFSILFLAKEQKKRDVNSDRSKLLPILWIDAVLMGIILIIIVFVKAYYPHDLGDYIIIVAICIFIYSISFKVIRESVFFRAAVNDNKYSKSGLEEDAKNRILDKIHIQLEEKYYLNPSASLPDFAKKVNFSPNHVSQVINEKLGLTFLELINKNRIDEAKKMILDPELNETVEGIAYSVGFNSKSTFHSAFKRFTGQTPSEYKSFQNAKK
jgi:AraC-like DNA-binding protein